MLAHIDVEAYEGQTLSVDKLGAIAARDANVRRPPANRLLALLRAPPQLQFIHSRILPALVPGFPSALLLRAGSIAAQTLWQQPALCQVYNLGLNPSSCLSPRSQP